MEVNLLWKTGIDDEADRLQAFMVPDTHVVEVRGLERHLGAGRPSAARLAFLAAVLDLPRPLSSQLAILELETEDATTTLVAFKTASHAERLIEGASFFSAHPLSAAAAGRLREWRAACVQVVPSQSVASSSMVPFIPSMEQEDVAAEDRLQPMTLQPEAVTSSVSSVLSTLPPPEAQEAFQRRFQQLWQKSPLPKMAKKKGSKVYQTGLTDPLESQADGGRTHEVIGVNTHVMTTAASEERPGSTPRNEQRDRTPSWIHDGSALHFDDQVPIEDPVELPDAEAHVDAEARNDSAAERRGSTAVVAVPDSHGKREREEEPSGKTGSRKAKANAERSAVQLSPISRAATAPGNETEDLQSILESSNVKALKDRLRSEITLHQQTRNHTEDLEKRFKIQTSRGSYACQISLNGPCRFIATG